MSGGGLKENKLNKKNMDLQAKLIEVLTPETGTSKSGTEWKKATMIVETLGQYPKKVAIEVWGDKIAQAQAFKAGAVLEIGLDCESREFSGKWYSSIKAWKINASGASENRAANAEAAKTSLPPKQDEDSDDLPF